ncbi:MAG: alkaline phosphatase D family protein, partial [Leptolyngbyaceae cyanobacterium bins.59]|nr:alkaline phosphatase D family protein [Leptolyngbyaceae cyanobacterium bins.59]
QAYYEHMPLRRSSLPVGPDMQLYRRFTFGNLVEFNVLDTRQYRTDQPCGDGLKPLCPAALDPNATMTGTQQEQWLFQGLSQSQAIWDVIAQQTIFARVDFDPRPQPVDVFNVDQWDGYVAARGRITNFLQQLRQQRPVNPIIITGDIHSSWANDIKVDFSNPASATVASEFVGTSISSDFPVQFIDPVKAALPANPHIKYFNGVSRGYVRCTLTRDTWRTDYRVVESILEPDAPIKTDASFFVEAGQPGISAYSN